MSTEFSSINAIEFNTRFNTDNDCRQYLFNLKWKNGYRCHSCGHLRDIKGRTPFHRRCQKCKYDESVLCHTMFQDMRMPVLKAFHLLFRTVTKKKGMSSIELSTEVGVQQKTAWLFKLKVKNAIIQQKLVDITMGDATCAEAQAGQSMEADSGAESQAHYESGLDKEAGSSSDRGKEEAKVDEQRGCCSDKPDNELTANPDDAAKELCEKMKKIGREIRERWVPAKTRPGTGFGRDDTSPQLGTIAKEDWPLSLSKTTGLPKYLISFHLWLRGTHHKCSIDYLATYYDEFFYRLNHRENRSGIFADIVMLFMNAIPKTYPSLLKSAMKIA